jgi:hypothetical protein
MKRFLVIAVAMITLAATALVAAPGCQPEAQSPQQTKWTTQLSDSFDRSEEITETTAAENSSSSLWWLSSGGGLTIADGVAGTWSGDAAPGYLRSRYGQRNPVDTDGGLRPQNLFRLLTRKTWSGTVREQAYFRVRKYHLSDSPSRSGANGLLLFSRYLDQYNLYYAGVRVDGHAIVKKKSGGAYYTLSEAPVIKGAYDRTKNPTLLSENVRMGLRSITRDNPDGSVTISLYMDQTGSGEWSLVATGIDAGVGGPPIRTAGRVGIRTDFMDVEFDDFLVAKVE